MPSDFESLKVFRVFASRLFERSLRTSLEVFFVSVTSAGRRHFRLEGLDLCPESGLRPALQEGPLVLPVPCVLLRPSGFSG